MNVLGVAIILRGIIMPAVTTAFIASSTDMSVGVTCSSRNNTRKPEVGKGEVGMYTASNGVPS